MSLTPGSVRIEFAIRDAKVCDISIASRRPQLAALMAGQPLAIVRKTLPLVYAICTRAQEAAADEAIAHAQGHDRAGRIDAAVRAEALRELMLSTFTADAQSGLATAIRAARDSESLRALLESQLLGLRLEEWLALDSLAALLDWSQRSTALLAKECLRRLRLPEPSHRCAARYLSLDVRDTVPVIAQIENAFAERPTWEGSPIGMGSVAREARHPLIRALGDRPLSMHWCARVIEIVRAGVGDTASLLGRVAGVSISQGIGRSSVETARGTLLHEVAVSDSQVVRYVVVAPTEWNFHPEGIAKQWFEGAIANSGEQALDLARRVGEALDPCVAIEFIERGI